MNALRPASRQSRTCRGSISGPRVTRARWPETMPPALGPSGPLAGVTFFVMQSGDRDDGPFARVLVPGIALVEPQRRRPWPLPARVRHGVTAWTVSLIPNLFVFFGPDGI